MKDNKTEQEILDWWIMNTYVEYRSSNPKEQERQKTILLMIDKELLKSRELSKNRRPEVVSEKEINHFYWNVSIEFLFSNNTNRSYRQYRKMGKGNLKSSREYMLVRGNSKEEFYIFHPKLNQICLDGIFRSLDMTVPVQYGESKRKEEREKMKVTK